MTTFVIRMAFAALEAMEELDLFGIHGGGPSSKIHVMLDEAQKVCFVFRDTKAKSMIMRKICFVSNVKCQVFIYIAVPSGFAIHASKGVSFKGTTLINE